MRNSREQKRKGVSASEKPKGGKATIQGQDFFFRLISPLSAQLSVQPIDSLQNRATEI